MNLILFEAFEVDESGAVSVSGSRAQHLQAVLRVSIGQTVRVGVVDGAIGLGTVVSIADQTVAMTCVFNEPVLPRPRADLLLAVPRPKVMRRLWAQLAALGVGRVILTNAEKVERPYFDSHLLTEAIYRPLLIEGLQQARDTRLPEVSIHRRFKPLVEDDLDDLSGDGFRIVADPSATQSLGDAVRGQPAGRVLLAVGPEGGWNSFELQLLEDHGFHGIGMGPRTLRTDTACLALLALVHDALASS